MKFEKLRALPTRGYEGLADFFQREEVRYSPKESFKWQNFIGWRFGYASEMLQPPEWVSEVFCELAKQVSPKIICDPWAGTGFFLETLREACQAERASAITINKDQHDVGRVLVPEASWENGDPLRLLQSSDEEFDVVASILPWGMKGNTPLLVKQPSGTVDLSDDVGNLILVASSLRLSASGVGLFIVPPSFFFRQNSVFHRLHEVGLSLEAAFELPSGTFAPSTNISTSLLIVRKSVAKRLFVGKLSADSNANQQVLRNFQQGVEGGVLEGGYSIEQSSFRGFQSLRAADAMAAFEKRLGVQAKNLLELGDVKSGIVLGRSVEGFAFETLGNVIYIPLIGNSDVVESPEDFTLKPQNYAQIVIDPKHSYAAFVCRFLNSEFGKEIRERFKTGTVILRLNKEAIRELPVFVPDLDSQKAILEVEAEVSGGV